MNGEPLSVLCLGGFGHAYAVMDDLLGVRSRIDLLGVYPAYPGEVIDAGFLAHPLLAGASSSAFEEFPDAPGENAIALVGTRLDRQAEAAATAAKKGWHLIMEKPLAASEGELEELHRVVQGERRRIMTMLTMRSLPAFRQVRDTVRSGRLGQLGLINLRKSYKWGTRPAWFGEEGKYPGTIPWVGIHALDLMTFVSGERIAEVAAFSRNAFHPTHPACEDGAALILRSSSGLSGTASIDILRPAGAEGHGDDWVRVVGEYGVIEGGPSRGLQIVAGGQSSEITIPGSAPHPIFRDFVDSLDGPREIDEDIGFHLTHACLAANQSARERTVEPIDPERWRFI